LITPRAYPGIYLAVDPDGSRARATVAGMLSLAGRLDESMLAIEGDGYAVVAVSPPGHHAGSGPEVHADARGLLIWAGEMFPPQAWTGSDRTSQSMAATLFDRLVNDGSEILADIDGSFCGAWFDAATNTWTLFNDRWGLIPLFWRADDSTLIASPKARLTWRTSDSSLRINPDGLADLLRTQNMLDDHTLIAGVHWLEPASELRWDGQRMVRRRYWDYQHRPCEGRPYEDVLAEFVEASRATMDRMTRGAAPVLMGLSGGLDSRIFLAVSHELNRRPGCYTSGFPYGEDVRFARKLARAAGARHDLLLLDERAIVAQLRASIIETDGLHGAAHLALSAPITSYLARHEGAVLVEGYLHGVLGGSDLPADADVPTDRPAHQHAWAIDFLHSGGEPERIGRLLEANLARESLARWQAHVDDAFAAAGTDDRLCRAEYAIITGRSGRNDVLVPAIYRRYVAARHPACDRRMIEWYATTPAVMRRARRAYIDVLRTRYPRFARVPRADGCSGMPLSGEGWRREYHWQVEKLYSWWARLRYPDVRRWGRDSMAARAWALQTCREAGAFDELLAPDARVREWVRAESLREAWDTAMRDPRGSIPLLTLMTAETMIRELERMPVPSCSAAGLQFRRLDVGAARVSICAGVS